MDNKNLDPDIILNVFNDMCCFVITDSEGRYLYANRAWTQTMGIDFEFDHIHGRFVRELIKDTKIGQALREDRTISGYSTITTCRGKEKRAFSIYNPIHDLSGKIIAGVIAAIMSTCADQLLAVTGAISVDIVQKVFKVEMKERTALIFSKILLALVGVATFLFALNSGDLVMNMVSFAWSGMGSSLGPVVLLTMLDKKASGAGIIAALLAGSGLTLAWGKIAFLAAIDVKFGAFFIALVAGIIVSRLVPNKENIQESIAEV